MTHPAISYFIQFLFYEERSLAFRKTFFWLYSFICLIVLGVFSIILIDSAKSMVTSDRTIVAVILFILWLPVLFIGYLLNRRAYGLFFVKIPFLSFSLKPNQTFLYKNKKEIGIIDDSVKKAIISYIGNFSTDLLENILLEYKTKFGKHHFYEKNKNNIYFFKEHNVYILNNNKGIVVIKDLVGNDDLMDFLISKLTIRSYKRYKKIRLFVFSILFLIIIILFILVLKTFNYL